MVGPPHPARAQAPAPAKAAEPDRVTDLTARYQFVERYATGRGSEPQGGAIGQYRVATREVIKVEAEKPQGAPDRKESTVQLIYAERPAAVSPSGAVAATVRRYDTFRFSSQADAKPSAPKPLEGLTVWVQPRPAGGMQLISLTPKRLMTEREYSVSTKNGMFLPDLATALPDSAKRIGDRWRISGSAAQALLGDRPLHTVEPLVGTLTEIRKVADATDLVAVIGVTGDAAMPPNGAETLLNAQILFRFTPPTAGVAPGAKVEARGAVTDVRLARSSTSALPGSNGRLRQTLTWELTLRRDLAQPGEPILVPERAPEPTEANSWLTYDDPEGRFHFRHPQELLPIDAGAGFVRLADPRVDPSQGRTITINLQPKSGNPETDRNSRDPEFHKKDLKDEWARNRLDVLQGPTGWLPEADWAPYKMKVYRIEAALKPSGPEGKDVSRIFLDSFLVLFTQNESLVLDAMTAQDPPLPFRKQAESILKTFALGPSRPPS
jgi:hypothetical protein